MLQELSVHEPIERGAEHLADADERVDAENLALARLELADDAHGDVGASLELRLAPPSSFPHYLYTHAYPSSDRAVALAERAVRLSHRTFGHQAQSRHCRTAGQAGQVFSS